LLTNTLSKKEKKQKQKGSEVVRGSEIVFENSLTRQESSGGKLSFAFVNASGPIAKNSGVQTSIRKHVMRDIGKSRRKESKSRSPEPSEKDLQESAPTPAVSVVAQPTPEFWNSIQKARQVSNSPQCAYPGCETVSHPYAASLYSRIEPGTSIEHHAAEYCRQHSQATERDVLHVPDVAELFDMTRYSGPRMDPFVHYPMELTPDIRQLIDHSMLPVGNSLSKSMLF
jgi:hypothetical protein